MILLGLSDKEKEKYRLMNQTVKRANEKEERRKAKEERNKTVVQLAVAGLKQQEIPDKVGCSVRTIKTILKDFNQSEFKAMQCQHLYRTTAKSKRLSKSANAFRTGHCNQIVYRLLALHLRG